MLQVSLLLINVRHQTLYSWTHLLVLLLLGYLAALRAIYLSRNMLTHVVALRHSY